jgi:hypothetical protein
VRRAAKVDANQPEVVAALRKIGVEVTPMHTLGQGVSDLLCSFRQRWYVIEVKDGSLSPSRRQLTADQKVWIGKQRAPVYIVNDAQEAVDISMRIP